MKIVEVTIKEVDEETGISTDATIDKPYHEVAFVLLTDQGRALSQMFLTVDREFESLKPFFQKKGSE